MGPTDYTQFNTGALESFLHPVLNSNFSNFASIFFRIRSQNPDVSNSALAFLVDLGVDTFGKLGRFFGRFQVKFEFLNPQVSIGTDLGVDFCNGSVSNDAADEAAYRNR